MASLNWSSFSLPRKMDWRGGGQQKGRGGVGTKQAVPAATFKALLMAGDGLCGATLGCLFHPVRGGAPVLAPNLLQAVRSIRQLSALPLQPRDVQAHARLEAVARKGERES
jgi:hypothetical protein